MLATLIYGKKPLEVSGIFAIPTFVVRTVLGGIPRSISALKARAVLQTKPTLIHIAVMKVLLTNARKRAVRGLTLIELVVVLAILVALVGLVLAFFPGLLAKASRSTSASSIQDVARAVQINYTTSLTYGNRFDSLLNTGGAALFSKLGTAAAGQMARATITGNDATALAALGISEIYHLDNTINNDATFNVTAVGTTVALANNTPVATISNATVRDAIRGNIAAGPNPTYIVFGLNKAATIIGSSSILQDAPVRAGANAAENPTTSYQRYGLVFLVDDSGPAASRVARFLGAVAFSSTGITTAESNLQQYYSN
jgi:Tfp pilus assembly protein PilE